MTVDFIEFSYEDVADIFRLENGRLYRVSNNSRWDGRDVTDQKTVRLEDGTKLHTPRVVYTLLYGVAPKGEVVMNDVGELVDITDNHLRMVAVNRNTSNVLKRKDSYSKQYVARWIDQKGKRYSKAFNTFNEATRHYKQMVARYFGDRLKEYGFYLQHP